MGSAEWADPVTTKMMMTFSCGVSFPARRIGDGCSPQQHGREAIAGFDHPTSSIWKPIAAPARGRSVTACGLAILVDTAAVCETQRCEKPRNNLLAENKMERKIMRLLKLKR
jgi:hypothetical protein